MNTEPRTVVQGRRVRVGGTEWELEHAIAEAHVIGDAVIVLFDADAYWRPFGQLQFGQFPNLVAFDLNGRKLWTAQLPTNESSDCCVQIESTDPLRAYSWKSFSCEIDVATGPHSGLHVHEIVGAT